jgi:ribonucleotide reductase beta subunit family protein with ferritin-like domain
MDCIDIHDCDNSTYYFALDLYKNQFSEIWHHEIINILKELRVFGRRIMLKNMIIGWGLSQ